MNQLEQFEILSGGNMNSPLKKAGVVYKKKSSASENIHALLNHAHEKGVDWIPQSFGIDNQGKHRFSFIEGETVNDDVSWLWDEPILATVAEKLRQWHDATVSFVPVNNSWLIQTDGSSEVICHNDFAPYNTVFRATTFAGVIDFDVCAPGSRLWDIAYTAYRYIPLYPNENDQNYYEYSPFDCDTMIERLHLFLNRYYQEDSSMNYTISELIFKVQERLFALAKWSEEFAKEDGNEDLKNHAEMYRLHGAWLEKLKQYE